jgi:O-antigen/teichoic acid export membrane protein
VTEPGPGPVDPAAQDPAVRTTEVIRTDAVRGTWWTAINASLGIPLSVVANLFVARSLGPDGFGRLASYMTAYSIILVALSAGVGTATVQWGAAAYARGDKKDFLDLARRCTGLHMVTAGPIGAAVAVVILHDESVTIRLVAGVAVGLTMAFGSANVVLTAMAMNAKLAIVNLVVNVGLQASVVTAAVATGDPGPVWVARLLVMLLLAVGGLGLTDPVVRRACLHPLLRRPWPTGFAAFSAKTLVSTVVGALVFSRIEVLILNGYGEAVAAGLFALAAGFATQITAPIDAMLGPLLPSAAALLAVDRERAAAFVVRGLRLSAFITTAILVLAVPSVTLLTPLVYGRDFEGAGKLFIALAITSCVQTVLHPMTAFVVALRRPMTVLAICVGALVLDVLLVIVLLSRYGAGAAVVGSCVGQLFALYGTVVLVKVVMNVDFGACAGSFAAFGVNALITAAASWLCLDWQLSGGNVLAGMATATVVSVVGALVVLRVFPSVLKAEDIAPVTKTFPRIMNPAVAALTRLGYVRG